jgi:polyisoprenoid-binding protein YceI
MSTTQTQATALYALDRSHSSVEFTVRHLMISKVRGRFAGLEGRITVDQSNLPVAVSATIDSASIDTREEQRDAHLRSADFFDVEKYPSLSFESTHVSGTAADFTIYGNLTIHGITREVNLQGSFEGRGRDPWGGERAGYSAHTTINRKDFGLTWNAALETGGVVVGDEIKIELNVEAVLQH